MLVYAKLSEGNAFVLRPAEEHLLKECKGYHGSFVVRRDQGDQAAEDGQSNPRDR